MRIAHHAFCGSPVQGREAILIAKVDRGHGSWQRKQLRHQCFHLPLYFTPKNLSYSTALFCWMLAGCCYAISDNLSIVRAPILKRLVGRGEAVRRARTCTDLHSQVQSGHAPV